VSAFDLIRFTVGIIIWYGICGFALWRGGWPERVAGAGILVTAIAAPIVQQSPFMADTDLGVFALDLGLFFVLLWVALRSDRWWPLFATAFMLLAVVTHLAVMLSSAIREFTYVTATTLWGYLVVYSLAFGLWEISRRRKRQRAALS